jgi:hypothetical protein
MEQRTIRGLRRAAISSLQVGNCSEWRRITNASWVKLSFHEIKPITIEQRKRGEAKLYKLSGKVNNTH